ncbi:LysR family transcriptional regulator [Noviherbaspirillum sp.]|uniref:LysR family transcriptional regulator n=1 Tax=Noviherbaspirillum sp. TaxID=1926288 RepID=UPI002FDF0F8C
MTQAQNPFEGQRPHSAVTTARSKFKSRPHDVRNLYVSLKQWRILHAVIDCGGFAEAADYLHLSQSAVSYTIAKLQENLGIQLLKIEGRKAHLTKAGRALLDRSRHVLKEAIELELFAKHLGAGGGAEIRLAVDQNFPAQVLMQALKMFSAIADGASIRLAETAMPRAEEALRNMSVDLAIATRVPLGFLGEPLVEVEYIAVAHPDHALLKLGRDVAAADLERHIRVGAGYSSEMESGSANESGLGKRWDLSSFDTVVEAVTGCLGYAWLPKHRIRHWLECGALVPLPLRDKCVHKATLFLIHGHPSSATPAASCLAEVLRNLSAPNAMASRSNESWQQGDHA